MSWKSWKPVRDGKYYCSPACGGKCTHAAYKRAVARSKAIAKALGRGWKPDVFENLGWHARAVYMRFPISVDPSDITDNLFHASIYGQWLGSAKTPEQAMRKALKLLEGYVGDINNVLSKARHAIAD